MRGPVSTHRWPQLHFFGLLATLCCTLALVPSIGIATHNLNPNTLTTNASILLSS
ncbi:MAG: hypothetical protein IPK92_07020 [Nitrospira sp.]|nr:hypothetical protein [Nitrospira sp.]